VLRPLAGYKRQTADVLSCGCPAHLHADDRVFARSAHVGVVTLRVPDASPVRWIHVGDDMALVKRPDVNIRDNLNKFGKTAGLKAR
jgi:hypothetical protein